MESGVGHEYGRVGQVARMRAWKVENRLEVRKRSGVEERRRGKERESETGERDTAFFILW